MSVTAACPNTPQCEHGSDDHAATWQGCDQWDVECTADGCDCYRVGPARECGQSCDHCQPEIWHECLLPRGHDGYHTCEPEFA